MPFKSEKHDSMPFHIRRASCGSANTAKNQQNKTSKFGLTTASGEIKGITEPAGQKSASPHNIVTEALMLASGIEGKPSASIASKNIRPPALHNGTAPIALSAKRTGSICGDTTFVGKMWSACLGKRPYARFALKTKPRLLTTVMLGAMFAAYCVKAATHLFQSSTRDTLTAPWSI